MAPYIIKDNDRFLVDGMLGTTLQGKTYSIPKVKDMPLGDKPREKMLLQGASSLSLAELVAILLGTGSKKEEVMSMSLRIVKEYGEKSLLSKLDPEAMARDLDIPLVKAMQLIACGEIGRRFYEKKGDAPIIRTARDVYDYLIDMRNLPKEHLRGIYLNSHYKVIHDEVISIGTINSSMIHPREVFKPGIEYGASALILAHNHPSGSVEPSDSDIEITKQLVLVGKLVGVNVIDHVIITSASFKSIDIDYDK